MQKKRGGGVIIICISIYRPKNHQILSLTRRHQNNYRIQINIQQKQGGGLRIMCLSIYRPQNNADLVTRVDNAPECESVNESEVRVLVLS